MIAAFMCDNLPSSIDPWRLAQDGSQLTGRVPLAGMTRLRGLVHELSGEAEAALCFGRDEQSRFRVTGRVAARVVLLCQRCLQPYTCELQAQPLLALLADESQVETLPQHYDPLIVGSVLSPATLVEDELILALPLVARHPPGVCRPPGGEGGPADETHRPFADLGRLLDGAE